MVKTLLDVNGNKIPIDHPSVVRDYFTNEPILTRGNPNRVYKMHDSIGVNQLGYTGHLSTVYTEDGNAYTLRTYMLETRVGVVRITNNCQVLGGEIYPSPTPRIFYDIYVKRLREGANPNGGNVNARKFRAFNNLVKPFNYYDNPHLINEDKARLIKRDFQFGVRSLTNKVFEGLDYTFGVELETSSGRVSEVESEKLNLKCEFDGSLRDNPGQAKQDVLGGEYITGVMKGDAGMYHVHKICDVLAKNCTVNEKCGVHVHVGNLTFSKENMVYLYILGTLLQNEIFQMLPPSRRRNEYCRKLKDLGFSTGSLLSAKNYFTYSAIIDKYYKILFREVSSGKNPDKNNNKRYNHPMGSKCGYNKDTQRYCWLNFVTAMFNTKENGAYTIEFRPHSGTVNFIKVKHWIKICVAFVNFAENHKVSIKRGYWEDENGERFNINIETILRASFPRTYCSSLQYVIERKMKFDGADQEVENQEYLTDTKNCVKSNLMESICA